MVSYPTHLDTNLVKRDFVVSSTESALSRTSNLIL